MYFLRIKIMAHLNYKHLRYFWMVAKTGSIIRASEQLFLSPQSISGQLGELEANLGVQLFQKKGRGLEPTDMGRRLLSYADEIFALGDELLDEVHHQKVKKSTPFHIGITDSVAKSVAYRVIAPVLQADDSIRLFCNEGKLAKLLSELSVNQLDLVIADRPMPASLNVRAYNHLVGVSKLAIFASPKLLARHGQIAFPALLNNAPFLMPGEDFAYQKRLIAWFEAKKIYPNIVAEFEDSALLKYFGQAGAGFFAAPLAIADYICKQYDVEKVGNIDTVEDQLYVITTERRLTHPAIVAIVEATTKMYSS
jgi:LysR family transcriptional regulator, transcriptional activator of nhaA